MGVAYYVVCHERRELFELGKGPWQHLDLFTDHRDVDAFCARFADVWRSDRAYALGVARKLWEWCERSQWRVELRHDWESEGEHREWAGYAETGSRHEAAR